MAYADTFNAVTTVGEFDKAPVLYKGAKELNADGTPVILDRHEAKMYLTEKYVGDFDPIEIDMSTFGEAHSGRPVRL